MSLEYNTEREDVCLKEYGRNIQKLVKHVQNIEDKETRDKNAATLTDLMKQINVAVKDNPEYNQKVWDDLFIMADFDLDVESPFPKPEKEILGQKPKRLEYKTTEVKHRHYGRNIELMIQKVCEMETEEDKEDGIIYIGKLMKSFYASWNKDNIDEAVLIKNIETLSKGQLTIDVDKVKEGGLFNSRLRERKPGREGGRENNRDNNRNNKRKNSFQKNRRRN